MARQSRLQVPGLAHYVLLKGHNGRPVCIDAVDRASLLQALAAACSAHALVVHAYALPGDSVHLLVRPQAAASLSRAMQALGRRYVGGFNRRHGHSGTLWDGRFRAAVIEPGATTLQMLSYIDGLGAGVEGDASLRSSLSSSLSSRCSPARDALVVDPPEVWALGNTPFEREAAYRAQMRHGLEPAQEAALAAALRGGWAMGSPAFHSALAQELGREVRPRPRGRPSLCPQ